MTSSYGRYQEARDTAWRALLHMKEKSLPVDTDAFAAQLGVEVHPAPDPRENQRLWTLTQQVRGVCVSLRIRGVWNIFVLDGSLDGPRRRFAVAHELGHLLLGTGTRSLSSGVRCFDSWDNQGDLIEEPLNKADYMADIFAIRLLAPACLLHELGVYTPGGIMELCGLPPRAAAMRAERMELLNRRNVFYVNPLEKQVRDAFRPYLLSRTESEALRRMALMAQPETKRSGRAEGKVHRPIFQWRIGQTAAVLALLAALILLFLLGNRS